jgi:plastocyanin
MIRFSLLPTVTALCLLCLTANSTQAQSEIVYFGPTPVVYYQTCQPIYYVPMCHAPSVDYGPPTYIPQPRSYDRSQTRTRSSKPTTVTTVVAYDNYFEPKSINVRPGTTVRWVNKGKHPHTATSDDDRWDSGDIAPGATYTATFQRPGRYSYYCRHHTADKMQGVVIVTARAEGSEPRAPGYEGQRSAAPPRGSRGSGY